MQSSLNKWEFLLLISGFVLILIQFIWVIVAMADLPETIPTHFDASGNPDDYGSKLSLFVIPIISLFIYGLLLIIVRSVGPEQMNYPFKLNDNNRHTQYSLARTFIYAMNTSIALLMFLITLFIIRAAQTGATIGAGSILGLTGLLVLVPLIIYYVMAKRRL